MGGEVRKPILEKIVIFCEHLQAGNPYPVLPKPLTSNDMYQLVDFWFATYIDCEHEVLFELLIAANALDVKQICDLAGSAIAAQVMGKTVEEIRKFFDVENDFSPEEEARIREEQMFA